MNEITGELSVRERIDRDGPDAIRELTFEWSISQTSPSTTPVQIAAGTTRIPVTDINDNVPSFSRQFYHVNLTEKNTKDQILLDIPCSDADDDGNEKCDVRISKTGSYLIDDTKLIALAGEVHYDPAQNHETIEVFTVDRPKLAMNVHTGHAVVVITVLPRNDHAPSWTFPPMKDGIQFLPLSIREDIADKTTVTVFKASDDDDHSQLSFRLTTEFQSESTDNPPTIFLLNSNTGEMVTSTEDEFVPSFLHGSYNLNISVSDGKYTTFGTIEINILPVNKHRPEFDKSWYVVSDNSQRDILLEFEVEDKDKISNITILFSENKMNENRENNWVMGEFLRGLLRRWSFLTQVDVRQCPNQL
ncbi:fat-like cadherin-related tumor suppressor homolog [Gigantopelta aegis]|uniref:fat-like cadherin-related tumor suppressor homolog n=1 Tax=Gigantopelta aegis TaxID=1735272 RepID=UPI001B88C8D6|nr:fat-like cadherin-related tumor suppressor homolog [Gigantopelta aegis]